MFWSVIGRILWARKVIVATATACAVAGGVYVTLTAEKNYEASARVMLNIDKPDPVTGMKVGKRDIEPYLQSQLSFIRDFQVIGRAVEALGWLDDPEILQAYQSRGGGDSRELVVWLAQSVSESVRTNLVEDSNIIEIRYLGSTPELAGLGAGAIRDAYIAGSIEERRRSAMEDAENAATRAEQLRRTLQELQARKYAVERETGVILTPRGVDMDDETLTALAAPDRKAGQAAPIIMQSPSLSRALMTVDQELAQAQATLGPNHPTLVQLRAARAGLATRADAEARAGGGVVAAVVANERAKQAQFEQARERVLNQRQDALRLRLIQDQINLKGKAYEELVKQIANLRQLTTSTESGLTPVGDVDIENKPAFPVPALTVGGPAGLGLLGGILIALLVEMFDLRVRTRAGLATAAPVPVLGAFPSLDAARAKPKRAFRLRRLKPAAA